MSAEIHDQRLWGRGNLGRGRFVERPAPEEKVGRYRLPAHEGAVGRSDVKWEIANVIQETNEK